MSKKSKKSKIDKEYQKLDLLERRVYVAARYREIVDECGKPLFSLAWIKKHILKIDESESEV